MSCLPCGMIGCEYKQATDPDLMCLCAMAGASVEQLQWHLMYGVNFQRMPFLGQMLLSQTKHEACMLLLPGRVSLCAYSTQVNKMAG